MSDQEIDSGLQVRILCVDDERNVLRALERLFIDDPYEIVTRSSGDEGLKELEAGKDFQIVISDYRMPGMNGVDFLKQVYSRWPETVRIVLSGYAESGAIVDAINSGHIYKFIPKPWNDDELRVSIVNALERYRMSRENEELLRKLQDSNEELSLLNNNLQQIVEERTESLELHNRSLSFSQTMMDNLPVATMGIDANDMIVHCNQACIELLEPLGREIFCGNFSSLFPQESCVVPPSEDENSSFKHGVWNVAGRKMLITMKYFQLFDCRGCVAIITPEDT